MHLAGQVYNLEVPKAQDVKLMERHTMPSKVIGATMLHM
jgi:hypothetical protein